MFRSDKPRTFLTDAERQKIVEAIHAAEAKTSAEIRVHLDRRSLGEPTAAARREFTLLGMENTTDRNGVLIWLAVRDHAFAVVGDVGFTGKVESGFWDGLRDRMAAAFKADKFGDGIAAAIAELGAKLATAFPHPDGRPNQLPDDVSIGRDN